MASSRPPSTESLPLIGDTVRLVRDQGEFYESAAHRHGDVVRLRVLGLGDMYLLSDPDLVERVLVTDRDRFRKASVSKDQLGELLGNGLVLSEGDLWRRQRQRLQPAFYRDRIETYADVMVERTRDTVETWVPGEAFDVESEMKKLTLRILFESLFGSDVDYEGRRIRRTVRDLQEPGRPTKQPIAQVVPKWVPIPMWRRYMAGIEEMETLIAELIERRRADGGERDDLLSLLLRAREEGGDGMSDEQLRDELMTFLFAGHETTATALTFTWYLLGRNPGARERLHDELDSVLGDRAPAAADLPDLPYTEKVIKEAMRVFPPVPTIPRETTEPVELGGYEIPAGETVAASQWVVHRDGSRYAHPHEFRPDRWTDGFEESLPRFAYFPFGGGPRRCIGEEFAMLEARLILATVAQRYDLDLAVDGPLDLSVSITTRPMDDVTVIPRER